MDGSQIVVSDEAGAEAGTCRGTGGDGIGPDVLGVAAWTYAGAGAGFDKGCMATGTDSFTREEINMGRTSGPARDAAESGVRGAILARGKLSVAHRGVVGVAVEGAGNSARDVVAIRPAPPNTPATRGLDGATSAGERVAPKVGDSAKPTAVGTNSFAAGEGGAATRGTCALADDVKSMCPRPRGFRGLGTCIPGGPKDGMTTTPQRCGVVLPSMCALVHTTLNMSFFQAERKNNSPNNKKGYLQNATMALCCTQPRRRTTCLAPCQPSLF